MKLTRAIREVEVPDGALVALGSVVVLLAGTLKLPSLRHAKRDAALIQLRSSGVTLALEETKELSHFYWLP